VPERLEHLSKNVTWWQGRAAEESAHAKRLWALDEPTWGIFNIPETEAQLLPSQLDGLHVVELGCGTGYVSAWLARLGALPVAIDPTPGQLAIARSQQVETGLSFPLVRAAGEAVPLKSGAFDVIISEYGAAIWADPYQWIPEAARLLRPGGQLIFLGNSTLLMLCAPDDDETPATDRLLRQQFGMHRFAWPDDPTVEFHLSHGDWIRLLRENDLVVEDLIELRPPADARTSYGFVTIEWARRWPAEEVWRARKSTAPATEARVRRPGPSS
jgi:SAM-dependent methyltransferase